MNLKVLIALTLLFTFSFSASAWVKLGPYRYKVPKKDNVIVKLYNTETSALDSKSFKVLVWNMFKGLRKSWEKSFESLVADKDILILQEFLLTPKKQLFFEKQDFNFHFATSFIDRRYNTSSGVVTGAKSDFHDVRWIRSYFREPVVRTPKMVLFTTFKFKDSPKELLVGNIHGVNFVRAYKLRKMLDKSAKVLAVHDGPAIFAGDFNTWTQTKLNNMKKVMTTLGFTKVKFERFATRTFKHELDHIWIKGLKIIDGKVLRNPGSDHSPLEVELAL